MKLYIVSADGFELGIINEEELLLLKQTDTKHFEVIEIETNVLANLLNNLKEKVPFYTLSYSYVTGDYSIEEVKDLKDINLSYACDIYDDNDYQHIFFSGFAKNEVEKENLLNTFKKHVDYVLTLDDGSKIEEYYYSVSKPQVYQNVELIDHHPDRTKQDKIKSDLAFESLKVMLER